MYLGMSYDGKKNEQKKSMYHSMATANLNKSEEVRGLKFLKI